MYHITRLIGKEKAEDHLSMPEPMQASDCSAVVDHLAALALEADGVDHSLAHPGIIGKGATHICMVWESPPFSSFSFPRWLEVNSLLWVEML